MERRERGEFVLFTLKSLVKFSTELALNKNKKIRRENFFRKSFFDFLL